MPSLAALRPLWKQQLDTWQRLKPWVRGAISVAAGLLIGGLLLWVLRPAHKPAPVAVTAPVSVRLPGKPSAPVNTNPATDTAPTIDNTAILQQLLDTPLPLKPAPFLELLIAGQDGVLPRIAEDGTEPWRAYARPAGAVPASAGKVAIIMLEAGLSERQTQQAMTDLPGQVSFAYDIYAPNLADQINQARAAGHEVILDVPMEPETYPIEDPGPETLLTQISSRENLRALRRFMAKAPGAFALGTSSGRQFVTESGALAPLLQDMKRRGLAWVDLTLKADSASISMAAQLRVPSLNSNQFIIDDILTPEHMAAQLESAATQARQGAPVTLIMRPYPLSIATIGKFIRSMPAQNLVLVPASAMVGVSATEKTVQPDAASAAPVTNATGHHD